MPNKTADKKVMQKTARKVGVSPGKSKKEVGLKDQYFIIREDLMKLRDDLAKGYDMTREWIDKKSTVRSFIVRPKNF